MTKLSTLKKKWLDNPRIKSEYDKQKPEFLIAITLIAARVKAGMTQSDVAKEMKTTQSVIARLEGGTSLPSMNTILKYAKAVNSRAEINLIPIK